MTAKKGRKSAAELATVRLVTPAPDAARLGGLPPPPPEHLSATARQWWRAVVAEYDLDQHHRLLLQLAAEALDRCAAARAALDREGMTMVDDRGNPRARPEVQIELSSRASFSRLLRELDLDGVAAPVAPRPLPLRSNR